MITLTMRDGKKYRVKGFLGLVATILALPTVIVGMILVIACLVTLIPALLVACMAPKEEIR